MNTIPFSWKSRKAGRYFCRRDGVAVAVEPTTEGRWRVDVRRWNQGRTVETICFQDVVSPLAAAKLTGELQFKFALSDQRKERR